MGDSYICEDESIGHMKVCGDAVSGVRLLSVSCALDLAIGDFFKHLVTWTSFLSCRLARFIEDLVFRDVYRVSPDLEVSYDGRHARIYSTCKSQSECSTSSRASDEGSHSWICDRLVADHDDDQSVRTGIDVGRKNDLWGFKNFAEPKLTLRAGSRMTRPLHGFRLAWRLVFACFKCSFIYIRQTEIRLKRFMSRVCRSLHGSSDDIGWLQRASALPSVEDGTARFMELLHQIRNGEHSLPNSFVYLLIPGLFSNHSPLYFVSTKKFFSKMGLACHIAKIHSEASVQQNAWELKQYVEELYWGSGKRLLLLGHSKGGVDAAAALSIYWSDLRGKVAGLALVQSPYGGTPIASDILRYGQIADKEARRIMELLICKMIKGDMQALEDLTYERRKEFFTKYKLPEQVPIVSFHTEASIAPGVLATLSHIAHAELPWLPLPSIVNDGLDTVEAGRKVPVVVPMAAAMAVGALHLWLRYGEKSDGLVTWRDAEVPGSVVVHPDMKLDHAWMVYTSCKKDSQDPDSSEMCEALLTLLVEIGSGKKNMLGNNIPLL